MAVSGPELLVAAGFDAIEGLALSHTPFGVDDNYFGVFDPAGVATNFGSGAASGIPEYTGMDGPFMVVEDLDGGNARGAVVVQWDALDIRGRSSCSFAGKFAAGSGRSYDADDYLEVSGINSEATDERNMKWY